MPAGIGKIQGIAHYIQGNRPFFDRTAIGRNGKWLNNQKSATATGKHDTAYPFIAAIFCAMPAGALVRHPGTAIPFHGLIDP
jgi:hypothetical protein